MNWYLEVIKNNYANFNGRARRKEYWIFSLINFIIIIPLYLVVLASTNDYTGDINGLGIVALVLLMIYCVAILIPSLAVTVRRLHDIDKSGWWYLLTFIPFGGLVIFVFTCLDGTPGNNRFGSNPKE
ncbi:TPA: DUF805 domain-containing protein [Providencia stuartii]|uniref:DUF805 domain-containing protein n=4 Tax=Providencia stuartii TaxID=588 RepID=A0AAJ1N1X1_PROST|nr:MULTISPECIES: DUF805 domain-containing protein [Providencia]SST02682.1 Inner membrane protein yhaI [Acinetobacter baumannii]AFH95457.1 hypothetical protein S70_18255 [Providencia stuartii MRSN 2154]AIN62742.1 inner membrane protein yhaI [Providencia stuartii]EDU58846.1 hypothetical protein PROSTU_02027 [Providencia stuartii ATCC 25827]EMA3641715.1 DUF805 domain-containing protein [Providencia stuartii]